MSVRARLVRRLRFLRHVRGWQRVADALVPHDPTLEFVARNQGVTFIGNLQSFIDRQIYMYGGYEDALIDAFLGLVPRSRRHTVLDIGANVGTHTLRFAACFEHVHAFEPNPRVFAQLEQNVAVNRTTNVRLHQIGLADREDMLDFHVVDKPNYGLGTFSKVEQYDKPLEVAGRVKVTRGDVHLANALASPVDAIKIDIQGFEAEALRGLHDVLAAHRPFVWFEVGPITLGTMGSRQALEALLPYDFSLWRFEAVPRTLRKQVQLRATRADELQLGDYVAAPSS